MYIEEVLEKIWEPVSEEYKAECNIANVINLDELFELIINEIKNVDTVVHQSREISMIGLITSGCPHSNRNGKFSGCSMCDYSSSYAKSLARINTLRKRSHEKYAEVVRFSLNNAREKLTKPSIVELITGYDCLNSEEIPDKVFEEIIEKGQMFNRKRRPFKSVFETRASSVRLDKLLAWKKNLGKKVVVEFGVEVGNNWVRNHWINKNISNEEIINAINIIRQAGCESSANILIGIPGCTERQSIELFKESFYWLSNLGADHILFSPLVRKKRTLQGFIYENLKNNQLLTEIGICNCEQTGMPWIFTILQAIYEILTERPDLIDKFAMSPANFPPYFSTLKEIYKGNSMEDSISTAIEVLNNFGKKKDINSFIESVNSLKEEELYLQYTNLLEKQEKAGDLLNTFSILGEEIGKIFWPKCWQEKLEMIKEEVKLYEFLTVNDDVS